MRVPRAWTRANLLEQFFAPFLGVCLRIRTTTQKHHVFCRRHYPVFSIRIISTVDCLEIGFATVIFPLFGLVSLYPSNNTLNTLIVKGKEKEKA